MGLDQVFYKIKRKNKCNVLDYFEIEKGSDILWLRKEYEISKIIEKVCGNGYGDAIKITHKQLKKIIKEYIKVIRKEEDNKYWFIMVLRQLELIDKLFNFKKYNLFYEEIP